MHDTHRGQEKVSPQSGLIDSCEPSHGFCKPNLGPLQEKPTLLTPESALQQLLVVLNSRVPSILCNGHGFTDVFRPSHSVSLLMAKMRLPGLSVLV